jgi:hypothetical protein
VGATAPGLSVTDKGCAAGESDARAGVAVLTWRCDTDAGDLVQVVDLAP